MSTLANPHLVVQTLNARRSIIKLSVHVYQLILEVLPVVALNVLSVLNVLMTKRAQTRNVSILVQTLVAKTPNVELIITVPSAIVWKVTLEIHSLDVILNHVRFIYPLLLSQYSCPSLISPCDTPYPRCVS